jgi:hypothetical protein
VVTKRYVVVRLVLPSDINDNGCQIMRSLGSSQSSDMEKVQNFLQFYLLTFSPFMVKLHTVFKLSLCSFVYRCLPVMGIEMSDWSLEGGRLNPCY